MAIAPPEKGMVGEKIKISYVLNRPIEVHRFEIKPSKQDASGECLYLQIVLNGEKRVLFTGSKYLIQTIRQVPKKNFPFTTTIISDNERYLFT
jgi:hypothetical protein